MNGHLIGQALKDSQLRFVAQLTYTGYPVAAFCSQHECADFVCRMNRNYGQDVYSVRDLDPGRITCIAVKNISPMADEVTPEEDEAWQAMSTSPASSSLSRL